jgi:hypothetical protein
MLSEHVYRQPTRRHPPCPDADANAAVPTHGMRKLALDAAQHAGAHPERVSGTMRAPAGGGGEMGADLGEDVRAGAVDER